MTDTHDGSHTWEKYRKRQEIYSMEEIKEFLREYKEGIKSTHPKNVSKKVRNMYMNTNGCITIEQNYSTLTKL